MHAYCQVSSLDNGDKTDTNTSSLDVAKCHNRSPSNQFFSITCST